MFQQFRNIINDLEAPSGPSHPLATSRSTNPAESAATLAENALLGLRKSFKTRSNGPRTSTDSPRSSIDSLAAAPSPPKPHLNPLATPFTLGDTGDNTPAVVTPIQEEPPLVGDSGGIAVPPPDGAQPLDASHLDLEEAASVPLPPDEPEPAEAPAKPESSTAPSNPLPAVSQQVLELFRQRTPLKDLLDPVAVEAYIQSFSRLEEQARSLQSQISQHSDRLSEFRETHRQEVASLSAELETLRAASQSHNADLSKAQAQAKEEEEKRSKSVTLLKALRQKLVKAEAAKEEAEKALAEERNGLKSEQSKMESELLQIRTDKEAQINKLRNGFEREVASIKAGHERELATRKGQAELEVVTSKAAHARELAAREARVKEVEKRMLDLEQERNALFEDSQFKTAELESSRAWGVTLESRLTEKEIEWQDVQDRIEQLRAESAEHQRQVAALEAANQPVQALEVQKEVEHTYKNRIAALESKIKALERERTSTEEEMARNMEQRLSEVERMRREMSQRDQELEKEVKEADERRRRAEVAEAKVADLEERTKGLEGLLETTRAEAARSLDRQSAIREELADRDRRIQELETRLEEYINRESQLRSTNRNLRDELRKVQSGVLNSEKARNPGVGYFSSFSSAASAISSNTSSGSMSPNASQPQTPTKTASDTPKPDDSEQAVNFEYIRNVILQFLEHKEMRPHLVSVLGVILHFTPAETRRLANKASS